MLNREVDVRSAPVLPDLDSQQRFWNDYWQHCEERGVINRWSAQRGARVLELLQQLRLSNPRILDFGCGNGWFSNELSRFGRVTGIDLSELAIVEARSRYPDIEFVSANALKYLSRDKQFDLVVSQEVLAHVEDQQAYVAAAANAVKPGGYLILTTANKFVMDRLGASAFDPFPPEHIEQFLNARSLRRLLSPHFVVLRMTSALPLGSAGILRIVNSYHLSRVLQLFVTRSTIDACKERAGLGYCLLAVAQKPLGR
jgi:2-polyprenyl-3-methyl-5-hydroxy-6-metoxy-1,4-benzoquinol methylase